VRRTLIIQLIALGVVIGAAAIVVSFYIPWLPELGSEQGGRVDDLYVLVSVISLVIFAIVASVTIYAVIKFRARPDDEEDGKPIHGHTGLEVFWTAVPAALVTVIAIYSGIVLTKNEDLVAGHRVIQVAAAQFAWEFTYPDLGVTTGVLRVPEGEQIEFNLQSEDVIHSFWVPEWRLKQDVVPGTLQHVIITPTKVGEFPIICTELCGIGHSTMRSTAIVLSRADFDAWAARQQGAAEAGGATAGKAVFENAGCGSCHTLADAGTTAQVGPNLDNVLAGRDAEFVRQSIVDPNAEIAEGYQAGVMPDNFGEQLSDEQLNALVDYLLEATSG
jgi:cytochrome c oxidase subunit II